MASSLDREMKKLPTLRGRTVVNLFYESSTRTLASFELAAKRLSADTMSLRSSGSSVDKGESLKDTASTLVRVRPRRHRRPAPLDRRGRGSSLATRKRSVVNAGDGKHQHPTQALARPVRDGGGARPARRAARRDRRRRAALPRRALARPGARARRRPLDADRAADAAAARHRGARVRRSRTTSETLAEADVVYVLRMQQERMAPGEAFMPSLREYTALYGITPERVRPGQVVMHPGPMNRGVEIDPRVADSRSGARQRPGARGSRRADGRPLRRADGGARAAPVAAEVA